MIYELNDVYLKIYLNRKINKTQYFSVFLYLGDKNSSLNSNRYSVIDEKTLFIYLFLRL